VDLLFIPRRFFVECELAPRHFGHLGSSPRELGQPVEAVAPINSPLIIDDGNYDSLNSPSPPPPLPPSLSLSLSRGMKLITLVARLETYPFLVPRDLLFANRAPRGGRR